MADARRPSLAGVPVLVTGADGFIGSHLTERLVGFEGVSHLRQIHIDYVSQLLLCVIRNADRPNASLV